MSVIYKNSLLTILGLLLLAIFGFRFYLSGAAIVPAWVPPPICPCWDSNSYTCMSNAFCKGTLSIVSTPTPYLEQIKVKPIESKISNLTFTSDCKVNITLNTNETNSFNLPNDRTISNSICPVSNPYFMSADAKLAVFQNFSNSQNLAITIYSLSLNKVATLENFTNDGIIDALFLPDNHLIILFKNKLKTYDLASLIRNYPGNLDFYQNKFKSIILESVETPLEYQSNPTTSLIYENNQINDLDLISLYPRSSCPCWDTQTNHCLPQSACLNPQTP